MLSPVKAYLKLSGFLLSSSRYDCAEAEPVLSNAAIRTSEDIKQRMLNAIYKTNGNKLKSL